jgi:YgiT-type zinc finger domain-containing protein
MTKKKGDIPLSISGRLYLVTHVEYEECEVCGEKVFSPKTGQDIFEKIKNKSYTEKTMTLPVLEY